MLDRYEAFLRVSNNLPIFNRREILAVFLNYESDIEPKFEAGIGLGYNVPYVFNHLSQMTSAEIYTKAEKVFGDENITVRYHPSDPVHADLRRGIPDTGSLIEFIRKSRRILRNTSALAYEAMLFNCPAYEMGQSQYKYFTNRDLKELPDHIADDSFLSFIAFGYCIPFELLKSVQYLRWRLSRPSEQEIYLYHLHYYMDCLGITDSALGFNKKERLEAILRARKPGLVEILVDIDSGIFASDEQALLYATIERYRRQIKLLEDNQQKMINELTNQLNCVLNSKSWRITQPLRKKRKHYAK